jgi:protein-S-isoprenylcysteine O-methyltransferase Ste14
MPITALNRPRPARFVRWLLASLVIGGAVMGLAGQWTSPYLWSFAVGFSALLLYATFVVLDDDLARERFRPPSRGADTVALRWIRVSAAAALIFAPLDSGRLHWSGEVSPLVRLIGVGGFLLGFWIVLHAMRANRFFSAVIRIQSDRGHRVVDQGPYAIIRHPGYLGMLLVSPMAALALGSWWALLPAGLYWALIVRRVVAEDRFLHENLAGYPQYASRVPHRVLPGVW